MADDDASTNNPQAEPRFFELLSDQDRAAIWDRLLRRPARPDPEPAPLTDFDRTFQELVPERLEPVVRLGATMVGQGLETFSLAHNRVVRHAWKYGAAHLSETASLALDSWIDQALLTWIDQPAPDGVIAPEALAKLTGEGRR